MKRKKKNGVVTVVNDGYMLYIKGECYVRQSDKDDKYYVCDVEGIAPGEGLEHIGDSFDTLEEAIEQCDKDHEHYTR